VSPQDTVYYGVLNLTLSIGQQEAKKRTNDAQFAEMRDRVISIRNKQDLLSLKKAEATIQYAV
jgi:two-component sensor histidine kinase